MKVIPLSRGRTALVDDADYVWLAQWKWYAFRSGKLWYAARNSKPNAHGKRTTIFMHRALFGANCDHRNRNSLDNRRTNLRTATRVQQAQNRGTFKNSASGAKGVHWHWRLRKWRARIQLNGARISLGCFESREEAARAYREAAIKMFGEFAGGSTA